MWIRKRAFEALIEANRALLELSEKRLAERDEAVQSRDFFRTSFEWARTRLNAVEKERAALTEKLVGVKVAVPEIQRDPRASSQGQVEQALASSGIFEDMGDGAAEIMKIPTVDAFGGGE